jgi:hypothetical protein
LIHYAPGADYYYAIYFAFRDAFRHAITPITLTPAATPLPLMPPLPMLPPFRQLIISAYFAEYFRRCFHFMFDYFR